MVTWLQERLSSAANKCQVNHESKQIMFYVLLLDYVLIPRRADKSFGWERLEVNMSQRRSFHGQQATSFCVHECVCV